MVQTHELEFYSVAQAAAILGVGHSTVWRWIASGKLPAYRVGPKNIRIKKRDLDNVIQPARPNGRATRRPVDTMPVYTTLDVPPLTEEERQRGLEALKRIDALQEKVLADRGGEPFPSSVELIREMREERSRQLDEL